MQINLYIFFLIIGTLIVLLAYYLPDNQSEFENFENYQQTNFKLTFPDTQEIKSKIASENYFRFFKETDARARGFPFSLNEFTKKYDSSIIPFKDKEKQGFQTFYNDIIRSIPQKHRPKLLLPELKMAKVSGIENSYPHTHEDIVVFDESYYKRFTGDEYQGLENNYPQAKTLIHEIVHVKQRETPTIFDDLYHQWGFQSVSIQYLKNNISANIFNRIRLNPDELPYYRFWVWNNSVMPLVIYSSFDVNQIDQVMYIGIDWKDKSKKKYIDEWTDYMEYFGIEHNNYHPIEILAEYQSIYYSELIGKNTNTKVSNSEGYKTYITFF